MAHVYKIIRHPSTDLSTTNADRIRAMLVAHGHASAKWMARADVSETLDLRFGRALTLVEKERAEKSRIEVDPSLTISTDEASTVSTDDSPVGERAMTLKLPIAFPLQSPTPTPKTHESDELPLGWDLAPRALRSGTSLRHTEMGKGKAVTVLAKNDSTSKRKDSSARGATPPAVVDDAVEMEKQMPTTQGSPSISSPDEGAIVPLPLALDNGNEDSSTSAVRDCSIPAATSPSPAKKTADVHRAGKPASRTLRKSKSVSFAEDEGVVKPRFVPPFPLPFASLPVAKVKATRNPRLVPPTVLFDLSKRTTAKSPSASSVMPAESASTITVPTARKPAKVARGKATTTTASPSPSPATLPEKSSSLPTQKISSPSPATPTPTPAPKKLPRVSLRVTDPAVKRKREEEEEADEEEFEASFMRKRRIV